MVQRSKKNLSTKNNPHTKPNGPQKRRQAVSSDADTGSYRIIGGQWRSRRLSFPAVDGLRPTTDRVRETVFNWLAAEIEGARVLDLFSGSGSLGLEALSRGASALLAIEKNRSAWAALSKNVELLLPDKGARSQINLLCKDALVFLAQDPQPDASAKHSVPFDIIFLDPPFRQGLLEQAISLLERHPILKADALIYIEREKEMLSLQIPENWRPLKEKVAGQVLYQLFKCGR